MDLNYKKMREILFRGKRADNCEWVEGYFWIGANFKTYIKYKETYGAIDGSWVLIDIEVIPESVGQFTGLTDKNGKKIFERDIFWCSKATEPEERGFITLFEDYRWKFNNVNFINDDFYGTVDYIYISKKCVIIGNIHDNPELIK